VAQTTDLTSLGGFDVLKSFITPFREYFLRRKEAEDFGCRPPKGIMLVGIPGTGKSLAAACIAGELGLPLYNFSVPAVFQGIVGQSEATIRQALKTIEALSPCALLIDEIDKGLSGLESSGRSDSGVTSRVIGTLLSWMQDCQLPIFKIATANTLRSLDGSVFRKGRWDGLFGVDLPQMEERKEIFEIHLRKRHRDPENFNMDKLVRESKNFVGSEIEAVIEEALRDAFYARVELSTDHLLTVCRKVKPLALTDKESIEQFRVWVRERAENVSSHKVVPIALDKKDPGKEAGGESKRMIRSSAQIKASDL
jgi:SpoVK/Ycf46/Vps4 family AAA+-type ATPase